MKRRLVVIIGLVIAGSLLGRLQVRSQVEVTLPGKGYTVTLMRVETGSFPEIGVVVRVKDSSNYPVFDMAMKDFLLAENGQDRELVACRLLSEYSYNSIVLLVDVSGSMEGTPIRDAKEALSAFCSVTAANDSVAVIAFADSAQVVSNFTSDRDKLLTAIDELSANGNTALYDAYDEALELLERQGGEKFIVALTDGVDNCSQDTTMGFIEKAKRKGCAIYSVGFFSDMEEQLAILQGLGWLGSDDVKLVRSKMSAIQRFPAETGGEFIKSRSSADLVNIYKNIAEQLKSLYLLTFRSPNIEGGSTLREIVVSLGRDSVGVVGDTIRAEVPDSLIQHVIYERRKDRAFKVGVSAGVPLVVLLIVLFSRRRKKSRQQTESETEGSSS